jgi:hypothetical protein
MSALALGSVAAIVLGVVRVGQGSDRSAAPVVSSPAQAVRSTPSATQCAEGKTYAECHPTAGTFVRDSTKLTSCATDPTCYEQAFGNLAYDEGPRRALAVFAKSIDTNRTVAADCHRIAHLIGAGALARLRGRVADAFALGAPTCWSGYYHGILERAFEGVGTTADLGQVSRRLCAGVKKRSTIWIVYQCVHGLGHGLMIYASYSLPTALGVCAKLETNWDQQSCGGGVFMENIVSSYGTQSPWLRRSDPLYPCASDTVTQRWKYYCYAMATSWIGQLNGYDWKRTAAVCRRAERSWIATCFQSMGRDASGQTVSDPQRVLDICGVDRVYVQECLRGAVKDFTAAFNGGERASKLCDLEPERFRADCYWQLGTILGTMRQTEEARLAACRKLTAAYVTECSQGASAATSPTVEKEALSP